MSPYVTALLVYSLLLMAIGWWTSRSVRRAEDFFVAGRRLSPALLFGTLLAANLGAGSTVGATGIGYAHGFSAWWWVGSAGIGSLILGLTVGPRMWRVAKEQNLYTVGDYLEHRYNRGVRGLVAVLLWFGSLGHSGRPAHTPGLDPQPRAGHPEVRRLPGRGRRRGRVLHLRGADVHRPGQHGPAGGETVRLRPGLSVDRIGGRSPVRRRRRTGRLHELVRGRSFPHLGLLHRPGARVYRLAGAFTEDLRRQGCPGRSGRASARTPSP